MPSGHISVAFLICLIFDVSGGASCGELSIADETSCALANMNSDLTLEADASGGERERVKAELRSEASHSFEAFVEYYNRGNYGLPGSTEYENRRTIYEASKVKVQELNSQPGSLWTAGINGLSDYTVEEFQMMRGYRGQARTSAKPGEISLASLAQQGDRAKIIDLREGIDWHQHLLKRESSILSHAADQRACGSCWAFASAKMLEVNMFLGTNVSRTFSPQEFVDCIPNPYECGGRGGCEGSTTEMAMAYVAKMGAKTEQQQPYRGYDQRCATDKPELLLMQTDDHLEEKKGQLMTLQELSAPGIHTIAPASPLQGFYAWEKLEVNRRQPLLEALQRGSVAVSVAADAWQMYSRGVFNGCRKDSIIDHAVLAVGYGFDDVRQTPYLLIQNSWGDDWGVMGGKILLQLTDDDYCGTDYKPEEGTACKGGPKSIEVCGMCGVYADSVIAHFK